MPKIEVPARYRVPTGGEATIAIDGSTVRACLEAAEEKYPGFGELRPFVKLFVNGDQLARDALDSPVASKDTISVMAAAAGG
ncbi:MAG: MoaD/ThiS family protein [Planctomycetota bacterium]|jgi:molybdopterin converting factor small subunit